MKVCIFGAGAVGGHMAVRLANAGMEVSAVMRGANLDAVRANGLVLQTEGAPDLQARIAVSSDPADLGVQDVVVISVKYRALVGAMGQIAPLIGPKTQVITAMNGMPWWFAQGLLEVEPPALSALLDPGGRFSAILPADRCTACVVASGNIVTAPGIIKNTTPGINKLRLGNATCQHHDSVADFAEFAHHGGYDAAVVTDIRAQIWSKLLINAGISSVATVCEQPVSAVCQNSSTRALSMEMIAELLALGKALGLAVDADPAAMTDPAKAPPHYPSFLQDLKRGRPLEIENGILAVVELAQAVGHAVPRLQTVAAILAARSDGASQTGRP